VLALVGEGVAPVAPVAHVQREERHERVREEAEQIGPPNPLRLPSGNFALIHKHSEWRSHVYVRVWHARIRF